MEHLITHLTSLLNSNGILTQEGEIQKAVLVKCAKQELVYLVLAYGEDDEIYVLTRLYVDPITMKADWAGTIDEESTSKQDMEKIFNLVNSFTN